MNIELYYCKGSRENSKGVIKALEEKGGINSLGLEGVDISCYYCIGKDNIIYGYGSKTTVDLLETYGTELQPISQYPRSWEEFCEMYNDIYAECYISSISETVPATRGLSRNTCFDKNLCSTRQEAQAFLALIQLRRLREAWIGDWEFEFHKPLAYIYNYNGKIIVYDCSEAVENRVLSFPNAGMAREFTECFGDLLEQAKDLL